MRLGRIQTQNGPAVVRIVDNIVSRLDVASVGLSSLQELLSHPDLDRLASSLPTLGESQKSDSVSWLPPIDQQEVWAAGVTYKRSQTARWRKVRPPRVVTIAFTRSPPRDILQSNSTPLQWTGRSGPHPKGCDMERA